MSTNNRPPLVHVVGSSGGAGVTTLTRMMGPVAAEMDPVLLAEPPREDASPWVLILTTESVDPAATAVWLRETALEQGWRIAAIATRGPDKKTPKAVRARFIPIKDDPVDRLVVRIPFWRPASERPLAELPVWDATRQGKKTRRTDGVPKELAHLFTELLDYITTESTVEEAA